MIRAAIQSTDDTSVQQPGDEPGELAEDDENADKGTASPFLRQTQHTHIYMQNEEVRMYGTLLM